MDEKKKIYLRSYEISEETYNKILIDFEAKTVKLDNEEIFNYRSGCKENKNKVYYSDEYIVCQEYLLNYYFDNIIGCTSWKQIWLRKTVTVEAPQQTISGSYAFNYIMKIIKKYYNDGEIENLLASHEAEYNVEYKQLHYTIFTDADTVTKYTNTYKYDINSAHCSALCEIFPLAKNEFIKMYKQRKEKPIIKAYFNYAIGELCRKGHRNTYNWIVQNTTKKLLALSDKLGGIIIYANTDGICIQDPDTVIEGSKELGEFKLEFSGNTYVYRNKNYTMLQFGESNYSLVGTCLCSVRNDIDLSQGKVVKYDKKYYNSVAIATNITYEKVNIK